MIRYRAYNNIWGTVNSATYWPRFELLAELSDVSVHPFGYIFNTYPTISEKLNYLSPEELT